MERFSSAIYVFVFVLSAAFGKHLHTKEYSIQKDTSANQRFDFNVYDTYNSSYHERFARHLNVQSVTEAILSHLFDKVKHRHSQKGHESKTLKKMMKNLKRRMKKYMQRKNARRMRNPVKNTTEKRNTYNKRL